MKRLAAIRVGHEIFVDDAQTSSADGVLACPACGGEYVTPDRGRSPVLTAVDHGFHSDWGGDVYGFECSQCGASFALLLDLRHGQTRISTNYTLEEGA